MAVIDEVRNELCRNINAMLSSGLLSSGLRLKSFESGGRHMAQLWNNYGPVEVLCIGTKSEVTQYLRGWHDALRTTGR